MAFFLLRPFLLTEESVRLLYLILYFHSYLLKIPKMGFPTVWKTIVQRKGGRDIHLKSPPTPALSQMQPPRTAHPSSLTRNSLVSFFEDVWGRLILWKRKKWIWICFCLAKLTIDLYLSTTYIHIKNLKKFKIVSIPAMQLNINTFRIAFLDELHIRIL